MNKNHLALIAAHTRILELVGEGMNIRAAIDQVLGAGTSEKLIGEVYDALRSK